MLRWSGILSCPGLLFWSDLLGRSGMWGSSASSKVKLAQTDAVSYSIALTRMGCWSQFRQFGKRWQIFWLYPNFWHHWPCVMGVLACFIPHGIFKIFLFRLCWPVVTGLASSQSWFLRSSLHIDQILFTFIWRRNWGMPLYTAVPSGSSSTSSTWSHQNYVCMLPHSVAEVFVLISLCSLKTDGNSCYFHGMHFPRSLFFFLNDFTLVFVSGLLTWFAPLWLSYKLWNARLWRRKVGMGGGWKSVFLYNSLFSFIYSP